MPRVLITGGAGFIGSHTIAALLEAGYDLVVIDSFVNSSELALQRVMEIASLDAKNTSNRLEVTRGDIREKSTLEKLFINAKRQGRPLDAVIHFAGLKSVRESVQYPLNYWDVNVNGTCCLLAMMQKYNCRSLIFSSSATIYGDVSAVPISESELISPINPYGNTKAAVEQILLDLSRSDADWKITSLRYFNPVGAHPSGRIGECPLGSPNNLFPLVSDVASGRKKILRVYGGDWPTPDKTCIRDYIHVMDLAEGHLAALNHLIAERTNFLVLNLGSGIGHSVLEVVNEFEKSTKTEIPYEIVDRRIGDTAITVADPQKAKKILGWETKKSLGNMCIDTWRWQKENPNGYASEHRQ